LGNARISFTDKNLNGKIDVDNTTNSEILQENHYYAFGMAHEGTWFMNDAVKDNSYQYTGKEMNGDFGLRWYDYGARWYDPTVARFTSVDPLAEKYTSMSTYHMAMNNPILNIDPNGMDVYLFYHVNSDNKEDNAMFWNSALTHAKELLSSGEIGEGDKAVYKSIDDLGLLKSDVENTTSSLNSEFGQTKEFGIWSHSGLDGPIGSKPTSENALYNGSTQMSINGWGAIDFNWKCDGTSSASFYGCNSGKDPDGNGNKKSFTNKLSSLENFNNVDVAGQPFSSYPSLYTNARETNSDMRGGNFTGNNTYMVASTPLGLSGRWQPQYAFPMTISRNGKTIGSRYQSGKKL
jgi:RHS repeat-associated protein